MSRYKLTINDDRKFFAAFEEANLNFNGCALKEVIVEPEENLWYIKIITDKNFSAANVNIEYMYAFAGKERAYMIFRVNDTKKAEALLKSKGLNSLTQEEIAAV